MVNVFRDMIGRDPSPDETALWCDAPIPPSLLAAQLAYYEGRAARVAATQIRLLGTSAGASEAATSAIPLTAIEDAMRARGGGGLQRAPTGGEEVE